MKTLMKLALPVVLAVCVTVPAANAHLKVSEYRDDRYYEHRGRTSDYFGKRERELHKYYAERERERRKHFARLERDRRKASAERERAYYKRVRHSRAGHRGDHGRHHNDDFWSIVLDVAYRH